MNTLTPTTGLAILTLILAPAAYADHARQDGHRPQHSGRDDYARVVRVQPVTREIVVHAPMQECRLEETRYPTHDYPRRDVVGPMIVGGLIGGALGHQIGAGPGQDAATLLGVLIGSSIARDAAQRGTPVRYVSVHEERCRVVHRARMEPRIEAYRVTYRHRDEPHGTRTRHDPGTHKYRSSD